VCKKYGGGGGIDVNLGGVCKRYGGGGGGGGLGGKGNLVVGYFIYFT
jgi:hypothetical protein